SAAAREESFYHEETIRSTPAAERGWLDVDELKVDGEAIRFVVIDTLLRATLPRAISPGATATLEVTWTEKVRRSRGRGGAGARRRGDEERPFHRVAGARARLGCRSRLPRGELAPPRHGDTAPLPPGARPGVGRAAARARRARAVGTRGAARTLSLRRSDRDR